MLCTVQLICATSVYWLLLETIQCCKPGHSWYVCVFKNCIKTFTGTVHSAQHSCKEWSFRSIKCNRLVQSHLSLSCLVSSRLASFHLVSSRLFLSRLVSSLLLSFLYFHFLLSYVLTIKFSKQNNYYILDIVWSLYSWVLSVYKKGLTKKKEKKVKRKNHWNNFCPF